MTEEESFDLGLTHTHAHTHTHTHTYTQHGGTQHTCQAWGAGPVHLWVALSSTEATKPHIT